MSVDDLFVETFTFSPHLETAGEVAMSSVASGRTATFAFLFADNPDDANAEIPRGIRWLLSRSNKVHQLEPLLSGGGVVVTPEPLLDADAHARIARFSIGLPATMAELSTYCYGEARLGRAVASSLVSQLRHPYPSLEKHRQLARRYLHSAATCFEQTRILIDRHRPNRIITFNGRLALPKAIAEAARLSGIPMIFHERGAEVARYELFERTPADLQHIYQEIHRYWASAPVDASEIATSFFQRRRAGEGIGWTSFVDGQQKGHLPLRDSTRRHIVYFSSSDDEFEFSHDTPLRRVFPTQRDAVRHLVSWVASRPDCTLTIRVHPYMRDKHPDDLGWWHAIAGPNVQVVRADSAADSYAILDSADVVLTSGSTMGVEATFWGRPSILLAECEYAGFECVHEPSSVTELDALLATSGLVAMPRDNCVPYGYYYAAHGIAYRYYRPADLFSGSFLGETLRYEHPALRWLRRTGLPGLLGRIGRHRAESARRISS